MPRYEIVSRGNGATFMLTRVADGATLVLQGDDAVRFGKVLDDTSSDYPDDELCDEYSELFKGALSNEP